MLSLEKLHSIQKVMLFLTIVLLPFNHLPVNFFTDLIGGSAPLFTLLVGVSFYIYEAFRYGVKYNSFFIKLIAVYIAIQVIALINGLINYPYYSQLGIEQISKLEKILKYIPFNVNDNAAIGMWLFLKEFKNTFKEAAVLFVLPLQIYNLYDNDRERCFKDISKAVLCLVVIMCLYSIPEILWLKFNNKTCGTILKTINPYLYCIKINNSWWPPVLWRGQLRSICVEPSFFGMISAFCIPFIWWKLIKKLAFIPLYVMFIYMLFLTKARTGLGLFFGELALFALGFIFIYKKKYIKEILVILSATFLAFYLSLLNFNSVFSKNSSMIIQEMPSYINQNVASVAKVGERSNVARFANIYATTKIGLNHPVLGVGRGLKDAYIIEYLPSWSYSNKEVRGWERDMRRVGILKAGYPTLNYYSKVLAESGFLGLAAFLLPLFWLVFKFIKYRVYVNDVALFCLIIFLGQLASLLSNTYFLCFPISIGLILCIVEWAN